MLVFTTQLCEILPFSPSLWFHPTPPPLPCVNKYNLYTYTVCKGVLGLRQINNSRKVFYMSIFLCDDILHCLLCVFSFYDLCTVFTCTNSLIIFKSVWRTHTSFVKLVFPRISVCVCALCFSGSMYIIGIQNIIIITLCLPLQISREIDLPV
jgi:hypothetical protein